MCRVVDLSSRRPVAPSLAQFNHPAGVVLPFGASRDVEILGPQVRAAISTGTYAAEMVELLPDAVRPGDRVLVLGAGLGIISTLIAKFHRAERVLAIEPDMALIPYLKRVHILNDVPWVETLHAVPTSRGSGKVPYFARQDRRMSSLQPEEGEWQQVIMVPRMDLNLMIADEQISLIVCDLPPASAWILAEAELGPVERIAMRVECGDSPPSGKNTLLERLAQYGFEAGSGDSALLLDRGWTAWPSQQPSAQNVS